MRFEQGSQVDSRHQIRASIFLKKYFSQIPHHVGTPRSGAPIYTPHRDGSKENDMDATMNPQRIVAGDRVRACCLPGQRSACESHGLNRERHPAPGRIERNDHSSERSQRISRDHKAYISRGGRSRQSRGPLHRQMCTPSYSGGKAGHQPCSPR